MNYYRYEWIFFDEEQEVGIFQGINDVGLTEKQINNFLTKFDNELPLPPYEDWTMNKTKMRSYFTISGLDKFKKVIDEFIVLMQKQENGFSLFLKEIEIEENCPQIIYKDPCQIVYLIN